MAVSRMGAAALFFGCVMIMGAAAQSNVATATAIPQTCSPVQPVMNVVVPGICNFAQNKPNCCPMGLAGNLSTLPDVRNCSTTCQSYYISYFCYFSCSGNFPNNANSRTCNTPLRTLFEACQSCNILNRGLRVDNTTDYAGFLSVNNITTVSQAGQVCDDFTSFGRRCEETMSPMVQSILVTDPTNGVTVSSINSTQFGPALVSGQGFVNTNGTTYGRRLRICTRVRNVRPDGCTTLQSGLGLYPISVRILVEARGLQNVSYVMADANFNSEKLIAEGGDIYRACIEDFLVTPLLQGSYEIDISVSSFNTFGTASSTGLSGATNQIAIPVTNAATPFGTTFTLGPINNNTTGVYVCNLPATGFNNTNQTGIIYIGVPNWAVPTALADFNTNTVVCCETRDGDAYAPQCTLSSVGLTNALNVVTFTSNVEETTFSLLLLRVAGTFVARGSITLVNARVELRNTLGGLGVTNANPIFMVATNTALRGAAGNQVVIAQNARLSIMNAFLILVANIAVVARVGSTADITNGSLVVAEFATFMTSKTTTTLTNSKIVQYTQLPGAITFGGAGVDDTGAMVTNTGIQTLVTSADAVSAVVAVSGTLYAYNQPGLTNDIVQFSVPVRISNVRGPNAAGVSTDVDAMAVPTDAMIPAEIRPLSALQTGKQRKAVAQIFTPVPTTAVINACGTTQTSITIPAFGKLLVGPVANSTTPCATVSGGVTYSLVTDVLNVAPDGIIEVVGVAGGYFPIRVTSAAGFQVSPSSTLRLTLGTGITTARIATLPIFSVAGSSVTTCSTSLPKLVVTNPGNRVIDIGCDAVNGVFLSLSEVQTPTLPQVNPALFTSNSEYCIIINQQLDTYTRTDFLNAIAGFFPGTTSNLISITGFGLDQTRNNQIRVAFRCLDLSSVPAADSRCQTITNAAQSNGNSFRNTIQATTTCNPTTIVGSTSNHGSNHALYGLFGLVAIPLLCCCAICLIVRNSRRRADNQYMQDAATFSNVASGPQPIAAALPAPQYDLGKAYPYPTGPIVVPEAYPYPAGPIVVPAY